MPGIVKRKYNKETIEFIKKITPQLNKIITLLPFDYSQETLLLLYKRYYPNQWDNLVQRYEYYIEKDKHLNSVNKKERYHHENPTTFFYGLAKVKHICSNGFKIKHKNEYNEENRRQAEKSLTNKIKEPKKVSEYLQFTDPYHLDIFIAAYHQRGVSQHQKIEIVTELKKFKTNSTITFFRKLNDGDKNDQVREIAFNYLQSVGAYVKKRKKFKGKIKSYYIDEDDFNVTPEDLANKIRNQEIQSKKRFDIFISHSYKDKDLVLKLKDKLNKNNFSIYCDWTSDNDFLKRDLMSNFTTTVLKERINQSNLVLFLQTDNSVGSNGEPLSIWVKMELEYSKTNSKKIFCLNQTQHNPLFPEIVHDRSLQQDFIITSYELQKLSQSKA